MQAFLELNRKTLWAI